MKFILNQEVVAEGLSYGEFVQYFIDYFNGLQFEDKVNLYRLFQVENEVELENKLYDEKITKLAFRSELADEDVEVEPEWIDED